MTRDSACRRSPAERCLHVLHEAGLFHGRLGVTRRSTKRRRDRATTLHEMPAHGKLADRFRACIPRGPTSSTRWRIQPCMADAVVEAVDEDAELTLVRDADAGTEWVPTRSPWRTTRLRAWRAAAGEPPQLGAVAARDSPRASCSSSRTRCCSSTARGRRRGRRRPGGGRGGACALAAVDGAMRRPRAERGRRRAPPRSAAVGCCACSRRSAPPRRRARGGARARRAAGAAPRVRRRRRRRAPRGRRRGSRPHARPRRAASRASRAARRARSRRRSRARAPRGCSR